MQLGSGGGDLGRGRGHPHDGNKIQAGPRKVQKDQQKKISWLQRRSLGSRRRAIEEEPAEMGMNSGGGAETSRVFVKLPPKDCVMFLDGGVMINPLARQD